MKNFIIKFIFISLILPYALSAQDYAKWNVELLTHWDDSLQTQQGWAGNRYAGCWGYADAAHREYAIVGAANGAYFVEITDDGNPKLCDFVAGKRGNCTWREYKTYQQYCFAISDDVGSSLQIIDMSYLPDSVHVVYDGIDIASETHTLWINGSKLYLGSPKASNVAISLMVLDLANNPVAPTILSSINAPLGGTHDMFVRNDTAFVSCGNNGMQIGIFDAAGQFQLKGTLSNYLYSGYNHSSVLSPDGKTLYMMDEVPGSLPCKIVDVSNLTECEVVDTFTSGGNGTPHNPFLAGNNHLVVAYYEDGLQIFDISDNHHPIKSGFFDTHYQSPIDGANGGYYGAWGAYTELPSGKIITVDMQNGLFVLDATQAGVAYHPTLSTKQPILPKDIFQVTPNPFDSRINVFLEKPQSQVTICLYDITGMLIFKQQFNNLSAQNITLPIGEQLTKGAYLLSIQTQTGIQTEKLIKQ
ncbi:MAG: choice-of-anchor B family protein [Saprospiraceae bacterium]|nr:choice-of-anchor B family protein [Saprospiraceae bacterium]MBP7699627.1 choice-of-anchor B family protein [Saprospiraceae bacterium]